MSQDSPTRRDVLVGSLAGASLAALPGCQRDPSPPIEAIESVEPLAVGTPWPTFDPFLFCVHHDDAYPAGNPQLGPAASLAGRNLGRDFEGVDGWRMYHGEAVPGFPSHPHRGFETVTVVRRGLIDHADSLGATARYGAGDAQWLTAGAGIVHAEMFPLLDAAAPNPLELFQIWLNLPAAEKFAPPHFSMLWREGIPTRVIADANGKRTTVTVIAGSLGDARAPAPPPHSWAARASSDVAIWTVTMEAGARWTLPPATTGSNRALYLFRGDALTVGARTVPSRRQVRLRADAAVELIASDTTELLVLQGRPIGEPVAQRGPFVMNTAAEIEDAFSDFRRTGFGGWPWPSPEPVHPPHAGRFARHADGRSERKT